MTRPELATEFARISGVVTDIGGQFCHADIIAGEMGIPCIVGTTKTPSVLVPGIRVLVDGNSDHVLRL